MRRLPDALLEEHNCLVTWPHKQSGQPTKELAFQQALRLQQALWREAREFPEGRSKGGPQGAWLDLEWARGTRANLVSQSARECVREELDHKAQTGKCIDEKRLHQNLISSQPLAFNLFSPLKKDPDLASVVLSRVTSHDLRVTRIEFEHSPGRGDPAFTGDYSASDVHIEYETPARKRGFFGIEVKFHENLTPEAPTDRYRRRYSEVAAAMGCFASESEAALRDPTLEQLWRDHLLVGSQLLHQPLGFDEGQFVLLYPTINKSCRDAEAAYREMLTDDSTFASWRLESFVDVLACETNAPWVYDIRGRYLDFTRVNQAWQGHYLEKTCQWAAKAADTLGTLMANEGHRAHFRPTTSGVTMVGLIPGKCNLGKRYRNLGRLVANFDEEFGVHCDAEGPAKPTGEKELQGFLIRDALTHGGSMAALNDASASTNGPVELTFVTDELVMPTVNGDHRLDLLAVRRLSSGRAIPVVIELKTSRDRKELLRQAPTYGDVLSHHLDALAELTSCVLGQDVRFERPPEKWIVWPQAGAEHDPCSDDFAAVDVRVVGYELRGGLYLFRVEDPPGASGKGRNTAQVSGK